ncbi:MAG: MetQ/NlpA family ABC transporter substrate-binding protein [Lactococcus raffinolactis]|jgi:D-methionine transport system substrate-binding protein|uniref:Lipoprotein n=1 Tax=Pseudolactococcus raffinolactis TaxID=1366 RepID=A0A2A5SBW4_9LACT|nr:MetQ/NlpA family ABC transporter substrate-binding protein [Lactococcus raffinolactis]MBP6301385.1 MetQ/NlpA family ABC transporter substrate-binding protein [Lactococcus sp.]ATC61656.1 metal ABC transporter substrate-binding protein [Lactococcus raffinolactis]MBP6984473.1 MetQ/NlpA family ABC transporter substrate-binding protein [Lactococcus sp.]MBW9298403.1 MetQ/NlpA family ABC transporter substrate-binding protein [Lactococcus raffinolactis]MBW9331306.1 MetQ/NlpA family ABC transporter 
MKKWTKVLTGLVAVFAIGTLAACGAKKDGASKDGVKTYVVGVASDQQKEIWEKVSDSLKADKIKIDVKLFSGYTEENPALADGSLDLNSFQHVAYLNNYNKENKKDLTYIGYTLISPFGLYSEKLKDPKDLKDGDTVAIPNDPTNGGRALQALEALDIIKLKKDAPDSPEVKDIESYKTKIEIKPIQADQLVATLPDVTAAFINTNYVTDQLHTTPKKSAIYIDTDHLDKVSDLYKNIIAVRKEDKNKEDFKKIVKAYQTPEIAKLIEKTNDYPAWEGAK